jgi:hypothetical protein
MTVEKQETNETEANEANKAPQTPKTSTRGSKSKEVMALSVKGKSEQLVPTALPGNRPIEPSHLKVISTYMSVGGSRPIAASGMEFTGTLAVSGHRPIAVSHLNISETYSVMGNRPVASNEIDDPATLMGFLD